MDQIISRLEFFAFECGDTINGDEQWRAVYDPPGYGPAPLVVPRDLSPVQRHGILRRHQIDRMHSALQSS